MREVSGVEWADAVMATPANLELLHDAGFDSGETADLTANDLVVAVAAESDEVVDEALRVGAEALRGGGPEPSAETGAPATVPRSLEEAAVTLGDANLAIVSVPGPYAALEAHKALTAGLHVLLFSDNVPLADE